MNSSTNIKMNHNYSGSNKKGKKIVISLMIFFLIVLIVTYITYSYFVKNNSNEYLKSEFLEKINNNDFAFFTNNELYTSIKKKMRSDDYKLSSDINLSTTMKDNMFSELDLSKFKFNYDRIKNNSEDKSYSKILTQYSENNLLTVETINTEGQFAIKSDEIVNKYVAWNKINFQNIAEKVAEKPIELSSAKLLKNFLIDREYIDIEKVSNGSTLKAYTDILKNNISHGKFSKKENVIVTLDSDQVSTTEYTLELTSEQVNTILNEISRELENDEVLLSELVVSQVVDFQSDTDSILEYKDNDNIIESPGQENNFNVAINIWGENAIPEEAIESNNEILSNENTTAVQENVIEQNNTVENTSTNQTLTNNTIIENTIIDNTTNLTNNEITINEQTTQNNNTTVEEVIETPQPTDENNANQPEEVPQVNEDTIPEEDNLRLQGFISINEDRQENGEDNFIIGENYEETIENIEKFSENINWIDYLLTGAKANCTQEDMLIYLQDILENRIESNNSLIIKMYVAENKTIKINFQIPETLESFDIEIVSKGDNEKYLNLTYLIGEAEKTNGYTVSLYKKNSDTTNKAEINVNKIQKNKISEKLNMNSETKGSTSSKKYTNNMTISCSNSDGEFKIETSNSLNFDVTPEIEELNDDTCLFIDAISDEELLLTRDAIKQKISEVWKAKNENLHIIDTIGSSSIVQQIEQNENSENMEEKEQIKKTLIQTLSNKMGEYLNEGKQLTIEDLEGLEMPGYDVSISISENLAIITVNGYEFKLDSDFNLSDS